jgi:hypothetical protein
MKIITILLVFFSYYGFAQTAAFEFNKKLGVGVNMGNMFEAPTETDWGNPWKPEYFGIISQMGFKHVRIPIRWEPAARSSATPPYLITPTFFARIKQVVDDALKNKLIVVINMHHHEALLTDVTGQKERFLSQWTQISEYFKSYSDSLIFEVLNEPNSSITPEVWNNLFPEALQKIRLTNPNRYVLIGTAEWGGLGGLSKLVWPNDPFIFPTIHYYNPFHFTHQGASWSGPESTNWIGTEWLNTQGERETMQNDFAPLVAFSKKYNVPVHIGEFGAYEKADMPSRIRWTNYLARYFGELGFSCAYWEFSAGFGIYDLVAKKARQDLLDALVTDPMYPVSQTILTPVYKDEFKLSTTDWQLYTQQTGNATKTIVNGEAKVTINNGSTETWHVQLVKNNIKIEKEKMYQVSFTARSTAERTISAYVGKSASPYTGYSGGNSITLGTAGKSFSFTFQMKEPTDLSSRIVFDLGKSSEDFFLDEISLSLVTVSVSEAKIAYPDEKPHPIPGTINVTYFDQGGEGVGYHDLTKTNDGDGIRKEQGVDTEFRLPEGTVGGIATNEWLEYTVDVLQDGKYTFDILLATAGQYGKFHLEFDGVDKTGQVLVPTTGSYSKFTAKTISGIPLKKGIQVMRIYFDYAEYNLGTITVTREIPSGEYPLEAEKKATIYPTPTSDLLYISGIAQIRKYTIIDLPGQILKQSMIENNQPIDLKFLARGQYLIRLEGDNYIKTEKLIKL